MIDLISTSQIIVIFLVGVLILTVGVLLGTWFAKRSGPPSLQGGRPPSAPSVAKSISGRDFGIELREAGAVVWRGGNPKEAKAKRQESRDAGRDGGEAVYHR